MNFSRFYLSIHTGNYYNDRIFWKKSKMWSEKGDIANDRVKNQTKMFYYNAHHDTSRTSRTI